MKNLIIIAVVLIATSCGKFSVDNTDPKIEVFRINGQLQIETHTVGEALTIEITVSDNEKLQEVMIRIQNVSNSSLNQVEKLLHYQPFFDIDSKHFTETISIPTSTADLAGRYEVLLQVGDANGNVDTRTTEFVLHNPDEQPHVDISSFVPPAENGVVYLAAGDSLVINGSVNDNSALAQFIVSLSGPQNLHYDQVQINEPEFTNYSFDWLGKPQVPWNVAAGDYVFAVTATDEQGHMTFYRHRVRID